MKLRWLKLVLISICIGLVLALVSMKYTRTDATGCNVPNNPLAGATMCQAYGPAESKGWPFSYQDRNRLDDVYDKAWYDHKLEELRITSLENFTFYTLFAMLLGIGYQYAKQKQDAHTRH